MKILDLSLTYHWFDEILSGRKKEEYREIKPFYQKRLMDSFNKKGFICTNRACPICRWQTETYCQLCSPIRYDAIRFHRGQGGKTTMLVLLESIRIGYGRPDWGAPDDHEVFIIKLGNIIQ